MPKVDAYWFCVNAGSDNKCCCNVVARLIFGEKHDPDEIDDVDVEVSGDDELLDDDEEPIEDGEFCFFLLLVLLADDLILLLVSVSGCGETAFG